MIATGKRKLEEKKKVDTRPAPGTTNEGGKGE